MQNNTFWEFINSPLMVVLITASLFPCSKKIYILFFSKFSKPLPNYVIDAGINSFLYRLSGVKYNLKNLKSLSSKEKYIRLSAGVGVVILLSLFFVWPLRIIATTPDNYTNLTFTSTGEKFILSEVNALSFPDKEKWKLDQDICHEDLYQNIATKKEISYDLVMMICTTVGLDKEKNGIKEQVSKYNRERNFFIFMSVLFSIYAVLFSCSVLAPVYVNSRLLSHKKYLLTGSGTD